MQKSGKARSETSVSGWMQNNGIKRTNGEACKVAGISDSVYKYKPSVQRDEPIMAALQSAVERYLNLWI